MRHTIVDLGRLCELWHGRIKNSPNLHEEYCEELLRQLGWQQPLLAEPGNASSAASAVPYLLTEEEQLPMIAFFLRPDTLDPPASVMDHGLDFCPVTRALVDEARARQINYALVTDFYRSYLYDARTDDLLLWADTPAQFHKEFVTPLRRDNVFDGSLDELRRQPRSTVARQLRDWCVYWTETWTTRGEVAEDCAALLIDRLLVVRFLEQHPVKLATDFRIQQRFTQCVAAAWYTYPTGVGEGLAKLFREFWSACGMEMFEMDLALERALRDDALVVPMLQEFSLLSRGKFSAAAILESFNHGDPTEKMRVRMVPDANEERDYHLAKQTLHTIEQARIEIDLLEEGYRAIGHWFDRVIALYERLDTVTEEAHEEDAPAGGDLDLLAWSERDARPRGRCGDKLRFACEHGFGVYYKTPRQYRIARLMLTLNLIERYSAQGRIVGSFPSLQKVMMTRPAVLAAPKKMLLQEGQTII